MTGRANGECYHSTMQYGSSNRQPGRIPSGGGAGESPPASCADLLQLPLASLRVRLRFRTATRLPPFKGSTFRGVIGFSMRRMVCDQGLHTACTDCPRLRDCSYAWLFESIVFRNNPWFSLSHSPPPLRILVPDRVTTDVRAGDGIDLRIQLYGQAIAYAGLVLRALDEAGKQLGVGIGQRDGAGRFQRLHVENELDDEALTEGAALPRKVAARRLAELTVDPFRGSTRRVLLASPLQLKNDGVLWKDPERPPRLERLLMALTRRIYLLSWHALPDFRFAPPGSLPPVGRLLAKNLKWEERSRYSNRTGGQKPISGMTGWLLYHVEHEEHDPLLAAMRWCGIGKQTVMGLGELSVVSD